jgi:hypothetical protein
MGKYYFYRDCEYLKARMVAGLNGSAIKELSCPARFNPVEGTWILEDGIHPDECPRHEQFMQAERRPFAPMNVEE